MVRPIKRRIEDGIEIYEEPHIPGLALAVAIFPLVFGLLVGLVIASL